MDLLGASQADEIERLRRRVLQLENDLSEVKVKSRIMEAALGSGGIGGPAERIKAQGFLKKKTPSMVVGRDYDRRWFVLTQSHLRYFEEKGAIAVDQSMQLEFVDKDPSAFSLNHPKMRRKFELRCENIPERDRWMALLSGNPVPSPEDLQFDLRDLEKEEEMERGVIDAQFNTRLQFFASWMEGERAAVEQRIEDKRKARDFALQLLATDEKMEGYRTEAAVIEQGLHSDITSLQAALAKETDRKEHSKAHAAYVGSLQYNSRLMYVYMDKWVRFLLMRKRQGFASAAAVTEQEKFNLAGRLSEAQHNGERFMEAHKMAKRVILDLTSDVKMLEDQLFWMDYSYRYLLDEARERFAITVRELSETIATLTSERDTLQHNLTVTTEDLVDTRERLRLKICECEQRQLSEAEAFERFTIAQEFHWEAFRLQAESVLSATAQTFGGRVQSSLAGWDSNGGVMWRDIYLWPDVTRGRLNYAHRDKRWGEVESIDLRRVTSVEIEAFYDYAPPPNVRGYEHLGFYIEMNTGEKHRFCAADSVDRSEWLDGLRDLLLAVCYENPSPGYRTVVGGAVPGLPPRPAQAGASSWAAVEGGGSPRAAAAALIQPGSPRRARSTVTQPSPDVPGSYGPSSPPRVRDSGQPVSPQRVTVRPTQRKPYGAQG